MFYFLTFLRCSYESVVLMHFVGAAPGSTNIRHTLTRLSRELVRIFKLNEEIPEDYRELKVSSTTLKKLLTLCCEQDKFVSLLSQCAAANTKRRLLIVIDALNQFEDSYNASALDWLPDPLPSGVH